MPKLDCVLDRTSSEGIQDGSIVSGQLLGQEVSALIEVDGSGHATRSMVGVGAIESIAVLEVLTRLPMGLPIAVGELSRYERGVLRRAPRGVAEISAGYVIRQIRRCATVGVVAVTSRSWRAALEKASKFAGFCSRVAVTRAPPGEREEAALEAAFYGIGLVLCESDDAWDVVQAPQEFVSRRHTADGWAFHEAGYRLWLNSDFAPEVVPHSSAPPS